MWRSGWRSWLWTRRMRQKGWPRLGRTLFQWPRPGSMIMIILIIYVQFLIVWSSINNNRSLLILRAGLKSFEEKHEGIKKSLLSLATLVTGQEQVPISYIVSWSYLLSYIILANLAIGQEQGLIFILCLILILSYPGHLGHWNGARILIIPPLWTPVSLQNGRDNYTRHLKYKSTIDLSDGSLPFHRQTNG